MDSLEKEIERRMKELTSAMFPRKSFPISHCDLVRNALRGMVDAADRIRAGEVSNTITEEIERIVIKHALVEPVFIADWEKALREMAAFTRKQTLEEIRNDSGNTVFGRPLPDVQRILHAHDEAARAAQPKYELQKGEKQP